MAVVDPQANITPSYALVQQALQQRATIEKDGGASSPYAVANAVATPIADEFAQQRQYAEKTGLETFKNHLQMQLDDYQKNRKAVTKDDLAKYYDAQGIDKKYMPDIKGQVMLSPEELTKVIEEGHARSEEAKSDTAMNSIIGKLSLSTDPKDQLKADALRALDKEGRKAYAKQIFAPEEKTPMQQYRETEMQRKLDEDHQKRKERLINDLKLPDTNRAGAVGLAQQRVNGIKNLEALFNGYKDDLTPQEWEEASLAWARILGGANQSSRAQVDALKPTTAVGQMKATIQYFRNAPTGTAQQAFAQRVRTGMARELEQNSQKVHDFKVQTLARASMDIAAHPEDYRDVVDNHGITYEDLKKNYPKLADKIFPEGAGQQDAQKKSAEDLIKKVYPNLPAGHTVKRLTKKGTNAKVNMEVDEHGNYLRELP